MKLFMQLCMTSCTIIGFLCQIYCRCHRQCQCYDQKAQWFCCKIKRSCPHIITIHCMIHQQHLAVKSSAINFVKANTLHDRLFHKLCKGDDYQALLLYTEVRWLSKGNSLVCLAELWDIVLIFVHHMETNAHSKKQKCKAEILFSALNNIQRQGFFYLPDLFEHVNQLNKTLQEQNTNLVDCAEKVCSFLNKLSL